MIYEMLSGINPFKLRNKNKYEKLKMITDNDIQMMPKFSESATSLLKGLLNRNVSCSVYTNVFVQPRERLGYHGVSEIKSHVFFDGIDWLKVS